MKRIICDYQGDDHGALLIVFGAMHGNEPAGVEALKMVFKMLEVEPITNPHFHFKGRLVGLIGNLGAYLKDQRYVDRDLNRCWIEENKKENKVPFHEQIEIRENLNLIHSLLEEYLPTELIILDLHTTSSFGGIFSIVTHAEKSLQIAKAFHAPVITGFMELLKGTTLHYFTSKTIGIPTTSITFESGQHTEKLAINRAIAAIVNCLKVIGMVEEKHIENQHDKILKSYSENLPKVVRLVEGYGIQTDDQFVMRPGYSNFQAVHKGEHLADDIHGPIYATQDALILMPLYQKQGDDGFFLVVEN